MVDLGDRHCLVRHMDQPQADYFAAIAKAMHQSDNIILCSAEPGWYKAEAKGNAYRTLSYVARIARDVKKDLNIPLILSGDSHHYARYESEGSQYITSGGGGAFVHGTLELQPEIRAEWLTLPREDLNLKTCYPLKRRVPPYLRATGIALRLELQRRLISRYGKCRLAASISPATHGHILDAAPLSSQECPAFRCDLPA